MHDIAHGAAGRKPLPAHSRHTLALLDRLARGAVPLAELRDPADQEALAMASRRGAIRLLLSGGTAFVVRSRRP